MTKDVFDKFDVFDLVELDAFDKVELDPEDKVLFSKELKNLILQELRKEIANIPIGGIVTRVVEKEIKKRDQDTAKIEDLVTERTNELKNQFDRKLASLSSTEEITKLNDKFKKLVTHLNSQPQYQLGGFAPPNPTGHSGQFLTNSGTYASIAWGTVVGMGIGNPVIGGTYGSNLYIDISGNLAQDNSNWFYDDVNKRVGIGTNSPQDMIHLQNTSTSNPPGIIFANQSFVQTGYFNLADIRTGPGPSTTAKFKYQSFAAGSVLGAFIFENSGGNSAFRFDVNNKRFHINDTTDTATMSMIIPSSSQVGLKITGAASQSVDYFSIFDSTGRELTALQSDASWLIPVAASGSIDSLTYRTDGVTGNHGTELRIKRAYPAQNIGFGAQLALEDAGNIVNTTAFIKYESQYFIVGRSDLSFYAQGGRTIRMPWNGGIECFTTGAFALDDQNNVGGVFSIPSYTYYSPGGSNSRCTTFSVYTPTFNTSGGTGPVGWASSFYVQAAPIIVGSSAVYGTWAFWVDSGTSRFDSNIEFWDTSTVQDRAQAAMIPSWVVSTDASRTARVTFNIYDTAIREAFRMEASGSASMLGFFGATAVAQQANSVSLEAVLSNLGFRVSGTTAPLSIGNLTIADATNIILNTTTGTKIGTSTSQKLAFYNSTPIVQPSGSVITALTNLGLVATPTITLTSDVTGILPVPNGGTGLATITSNTLIKGNGTSAMVVTGVTVDSSDELYGYKAKLNVQTGTTYTLQASDTGKVVTLSNGSAITLTLPNSLLTGFCCTIVQKGAGQVTLSAAAGATLRNRQSFTKLAGQYAIGTLYVDSNSGGSAADYYFGGDGA